MIVLYIVMALTLAPPKYELGGASKPRPDQVFRTDERV